MRLLFKFKGAAREEVYLWYYKKRKNNGVYRIPRLQFLSVTQMRVKRGLKGENNIAEK